MTLPSPTQHERTIAIGPSVASARSGLDVPVLVLNRNYQAVRITSGKVALAMVFVGRAEALTDAYEPHAFESWAARGGHDERVVLTSRGAIDVPQLILLRQFGRVPAARLRLSRKNIFLRDGRICQYCGDDRELTLDHVLPRSRGGGTTWENLVTSCRSCNLSKADRTPEEAGMLLAILPRRPQLSVDTRFSHVTDPPPAWEPFLVRRKAG